MRALRFLLPVLALAGCPYLKTRQATPALTLQIEVRYDAGTRLLKLGGALHSGEDFALVVRPARALRLYGLRHGPAGYTPLGDPGTLGAADEVRHLPREGWARLDGPPGPEEVVLVAAPGPLAPEAVRAAAERAGTPCAAGPRVSGREGDAPPPPPPPPPPAQQTMGGRGDKDTVPGCADAQGVVVAHFPYQHVAADQGGM